MYQSVITRRWVWPTMARPLRPVAPRTPRGVVITLTAAALTLSTLSGPVLPTYSQEFNGVPQEAQSSDELEYLNRGPIHESFAEVMTDGSSPGILVPEEPPPPVNEIPPELKPEGENVVWLPGYWGWDADRSEFIWISGVWRKIPPDRRWVPGYWIQAEGGYRWISGFWADAVAEAEIQYLPYPPESLEEGPSSPAPGDNYFYVPGTWEYVDTDYQWRPGYWAVSHTDWVWVPQRYVWTPRGCIFRTGYWDYVPAARGTFFVPVYYQTPVYLRPSYYYVPRVVVDLGPSFFVHLFVNPRYGHYFFGDYYADRYRQFNILPWVNVWTSYRRYDPLFAYYYYGGPRQSLFLDRVQSWNRYFHSHPDYRPGHRWNERVVNVRDENVRRMISYSSRFDEFVRAADRRRQFVSLNEELRQQFRREADPFRDLRRLRAEFEGSGRDRTDVDRRGPQRDASRFRLPELSEWQRRRIEAARRDVQARARSSRPGDDRGDRGIAGEDGRREFPTSRQRDGDRREDGSRQGQRVDERGREDQDGTRPGGTERTDRRDQQEGSAKPDVRERPGSIPGKDARGDRTPRVPTPGSRAGEDVRGRPGSELPQPRTRDPLPTSPEGAADAQRDFPRQPPAARGREPGSDPGRLRPGQPGAEDRIRVDRPDFDRRRPAPSPGKAESTPPGAGPGGLPGQPRVQPDRGSSAERTPSSDPSRLRVQPDRRPSSDVPPGAPGRIRVQPDRQPPAGRGQPPAGSVQPRSEPRAKGAPDRPPRDFPSVDSRRGGGPERSAPGRGPEVRPERNPGGKGKSSAGKADRDGSPEGGKGKGKKE